MITAGLDALVNAIHWANNLSSNFELPPCGELTATS